MYVLFSIKVDERKYHGPLQSKSYDDHMTEMPLDEMSRIRESH